MYTFKVRDRPIPSPPSTNLTDIIIRLNHRARHLRQLYPEVIFQTLSLTHTLPTDCITRPLKRTAIRRGITPMTVKRYIPAHVGHCSRSYGRADQWIRLPAHGFPLVFYHSPESLTCTVTQLARQTGRQENRSIA